MSVRRTGRRRTITAIAMGVVVVAGAMLAGQAIAETAPESTTAKAAHQQPLAEGTPCTITAKACVDLESQQAWLLENGAITRGPVPIASGGKGAETPVGYSLRVYRKEKDHVSGESSTNGIPDGMPWAVFFEDGGIAFHGGDPNTASGGCIHLEPSDAEAWFNYLQISDQVQVVKASEVQAARGM